MISESDANKYPILGHMKRRWLETGYVNIIEQFRFCINFFKTEYFKQHPKIWNEMETKEAIKHDLTIISNDMVTWFKN